MKDKILNKKHKNIKTKEVAEPGYILIMTLVLSSIILSFGLTVATMIQKEIVFSRMVASNREAYFAADSGLECAQYIDNVFRDNSKGVSLFLNKITPSTPLNPKKDFENNASVNVFFASSSIPEVSYYVGESFKTKISCASNGDYNQIFSDLETRSYSAGFVDNRDDVINNLLNKKTSYSIVGDSTQATTTFGLVIREKDAENKDTFRCVVVDFYKKYSPSSIPGQILLTEKYSIISTGYSSCDLNDKNTVSRTIERYSGN